MTCSNPPGPARLGRLPGMALGVAATILLVACTGGSGGSASPVATSAVDLPPSYKFVPPAITVAVDTTVTWTNSDNFSHTVDIADDPAEPLFMSPGERVTYTFDSPGTFAYVCSLHPNDMTGTVIVTGS